MCPDLDQGCGPEPRQHQVETLNPKLSCRDCLCPAILTRGADQMPVSTKFDMRDDPNVVRNYGRMLVELASVIPDGIVAFFVSYSYMDTIVSKWDQMGILQVCSCV